MINEQLKTIRFLFRCYQIRRNMLYRNKIFIFIYHNIYTSCVHYLIKFNWFVVTNKPTWAGSIYCDFHFSQLYILDLSIKIFISYRIVSIYIYIYCEILHSRVDECMCQILHPTRFMSLLAQVYMALLAHSCICQN